MPVITVQVDDTFVDTLAAAIVARQLGGQQAPSGSPPPPPPPSGADQADPWDNSWPPGEQGTAGNSAPPPPPPAPPAGAQQTGRFTVTTPKGNQTWDLGLANAPQCHCGLGAAFIQGYTNGKAWKRWGCVRGKDKDTWRDKCDFSQWG